jgi:hypothetical protein
MVFLRNRSVDTLHKGETEVDDNNNNNNNKHIVVSDGVHILYHFINHLQPTGRVMHKQV